VPDVPDRVVTAPSCWIHAATSAGLGRLQQVPPAEREALYDIICATQRGGRSPPPTPRRDRLTTSPRLAPRDAAPVMALAPLPDLRASSTPFRVPDSAHVAQRGVVRGDARCAGHRGRVDRRKVTRDRLMADLHARAPGATGSIVTGTRRPDHLARGCTFGYSDVHRRSSAPSLFDTMER